MDTIFSKSFSEVTSELRATGKHSDVRIVLNDGSSYDLHKAILAACSSLLRKMFYYNPGKMEYHLGVVTKREFERVLSLGQGELGCCYFGLQQLTFRGAKSGK